MNRITEFLKSGLSKAGAGMLVAILSVCFPWVPGYAVAAVAMYYCIHWCRPAASAIYEDLRETSHAD